MLTCTVTIATHNRLADLQRTLAAVAALDPAPGEVIVCADGCSDGTEAFIEGSHPTIRLISNETPRGSVASRDAMIRVATGDVILSLDDDSYPVETGFIAGMCELFEKSPRLAVATFPQRSDEFPDSLMAVDFGGSRPCGSYLNSGAAIRRETFLKLGGYPTFFFHAYEEPDFAARCVCGGFDVLFFSELTIRHHYTGAQRNEMRTHFFHARNELWSVALRCPLPFAIPVGLFRAARQFGYACQRGSRWILSEPRWWLSCVRGLPRCLAERKPLPWTAYRNWMKLVRESSR